MRAVGERHHEPGALALEWTGAVWTSVCPVDDVPLTARDGRGRLSCQVCGRHHNELSEIAKQR